MSPSHTLQALLLVVYIPIRCHTIQKGPAAAVTLAFAIKHKVRLHAKIIVLIVCGGRVEEIRFNNIIKCY